MIQNLYIGPWAMAPDRLEKLFAKFQDSPLLAVDGKRFAASRSGQPDRGPGYELQGGTAVIDIKGILLPAVPWFFEDLGISATAVGDIEAALLAALEDDDRVRDIMLSISSPGGHLSGIQPLADMIYAARSEKPIRAHISDVGASGAYWLASQGQPVTANRAALVGSIGVYEVIVDSSEAAEKAGVKVHVVGSGEYKGAGYPGTVVTENHRKAIHEEVMDLGEIFLSAVARGRGVSEAKLRPVMCGKIYIAEKAKALGLIDGITNEGAKPSQAVTAEQRFNSRVAELMSGHSLTEAGAVRWIVANEPAVHHNLMTYLSAKGA